TARAPRRKRRRTRAWPSPKRGPLASRPSARISSERATSCASATKSDHSSRAMRSSRRLPRPSRRSGANASANVAASPRTSAAPKGCRRIAEGVAIFVAPDAATALAAATTLRAGAVIAPSGLLVLPGLARIVDPTKRAERDATAQLAGMAARLHEELMTAERAQRDILAQRADAERRREEADKRLATAHGARGDAEVAADRLATSEADVRDLVRAQEASATAIERERAELLGRREKLARES